jgi:hypothetical protein
MMSTYAMIKPETNLYLTLFLSIFKSIELTLHEGVNPKIKYIGINN